jgi:hypothetical protein
VQGVLGADPVSAATVDDYLPDCGATVVEVPEDTWQGSVAQSMETYCDIPWLTCRLSRRAAGDLVFERTLEVTPPPVRDPVNRCCGVSN